MRPIPRDPRWDSTWAFRRDPFGFVSKGCERAGADLFEARILLRRTLCLRGPRAAALFYDGDRFERNGATPGRIQKTLFGRGGVQGLDGEAHRHRKRMFLSLMTPGGIDALAAAFADELRVAAAGRWEQQREVVLYREVQEILCRVACAWAGVALESSEVQRRTRELTLLFDAAGALGPRHWAARIARRRADAWARERIEEVRASERAPGTSPIEEIARHRDLAGRPLAADVAAVELLNLLRPIVAVSVYVTFVALSLHRFPHCRERAASGDERDVDAFVHEVRRFHPFFPAVAARARKSFEWRGYRIPRGTRALLDLYGTNHDPSAWKEPEVFQPERFRGREQSAFDEVPQGGGDVERNHRCPGEWITLALMRVALRLLVHEIGYEVPAQDLRVDSTRLPPLPRSGFVMRAVRWRPHDGRR